MTDQKTQARRAIKTPAETARLTVQRIRAMAKNKHRAMPFPVPKIDTYFMPLMPGELCGIQAQSSNYKTAFKTMWARHLAHYLAGQDRGNEVIFYADVENSVETMGINETARMSDHSVADLSRGNVRDWRKVIQAADKIAGIEIYRIAATLGQDDMPDLYLSNIYRGIKLAVDGELYDRPLMPAAIFVDYLQALPIDPEVKQGSRQIKEQRRLQVRQDVYRMRRMANHFECPVIVGIQSKQNLGGAPGPNMQIPGLYDGEETSAIAQRLDRYLSLWMPKMTHTVGDQLHHGKKINFTVEENMLWIKVLKQRGGLPSGRAWLCEIDFGSQTVSVNDERTVSSNNGTGASATPGRYKQPEDAPIRF